MDGIENKVNQQINLFALSLVEGDKDDATESWIDVFKLPRDNWVRDVEAAIAKQQQQQQQEQPSHVKSTEDLSNAQVCVALS